VFPEAENVLYAFIEEPQTLPANELIGLLQRGGILPAKVDPIVELLLWFGVLGARQMDGTVAYIYNVNYEMPILSGIIRKLASQGVVYVVNPAFVPGLHIQGDPL
jgi:hypothetical protein